MRINLNPGGVEAQEFSQAAQSAARMASAAGNANTVAPDTAQLSTDQGRVQSLAAQLNNIPEVRQEKVEALRRSLGDGSYQVTPEQTADAMLSDISTRTAA